MWENCERKMFIISSLTHRFLREGNVSVTLGGLVSGISLTREQKPASNLWRINPVNVWCKRTGQLWGMRRREVKYFSTVARVSAMIRHAFWSSECTWARLGVLGLRYAFTHSCESFVWSMLSQERRKKKKWSVCFQCPPVRNCWVDLGFVVVVVVIVVVLALPRQAGTPRHCLFAPLPGGIFPSLWTLPKTGQLHSAILTQRLQGADSIIHRLLSGILLTHTYKVYMQRLPRMQMDVSLLMLMSHAAPSQTYSGAFFI